MVDESLTILSGPVRKSTVKREGTWKLTNLRTFTDAVKEELRISRASGAATHCVSLCNGQALVRLNYWSLRFFAARDSNAFALAGAELQRVDVLAPQERLKELGYLQNSFLDQAAQLRKSTVSFHNDVEGGHRVLVLHRVSHVTATAARFVEDVKDNDSFCISLSLSFAEDQTGMLLGIFQHMEAAIAYLQSFQMWVDGKDASFQGLEVQSVEVHARSSALKQLVDRPNLPKMEIYQIFPLSFEDSKTTDRKGTMEDFVADVEEIRKYCRVEQAMIVGHSMGSAIALQYAVKYPERVERLCLCAAAPKVGQAAFENWMRMAGDGRSWDQQVIRNTVAVVNISDDLIRQLPAPTLLINAKDDQLTPLVGSEMIRSNLQSSMLYVPEFGGHACLVRNDTAMERMVQFLHADAAMIFLVDTLFEEQLVNTWNLSKDKHFLRYYLCGRALAEVEALERQRRMIPNQADRARVREQLKEAEAQVVQQRLGLASKTETPQEMILAEMIRMTARMSTPARAAVQKAGVWWRDTGAALRRDENAKRGYSVDAWGRRRGGSSGQCQLFRWSPLSVPVGELTDLTRVDPTSEYFLCHWCGGPASAHEDKGPASEEELRENRQIVMPKKLQAIPYCHPAVIPAQ
ncbi:Putative aminoacrylate hydrolase RutD (Aminohydrolase) [Durusdinium trenchii]|uniref:Aminoacrylate hydrolase RutD (Aminohydrolase) n=1 Tax=Durusdinium trenchii TaxID=1381693 RepID=A0ABP0JF53_9DINO